MSRRGNGEGSVFQIKSGRKEGAWAGALSLPGGRRKILYGKTREEVGRKLAAMLREHHLGVLPKAGNLSVREYLSSWLEAKEDTVRPSTFQRYRQIVVNDLIPILGKIRLERLSAGEVEYLLRAKRAAGQSPRTVHHLRAVLRTALNHARRQELIFKNAAELAQPPRVPHVPVRPLDPEQAGRLLAAVRDDRLAALYSVALSLGLRQGEILGLKWEEVDLASGTMHMVHELQRIGGELRLVEVKTRGSHRTLHLPASILAELRDHRQRQIKEQLAAEYWEESGFVFTTGHGLPLDGDRLRRHFLVLLAKAGLPHMRFYDLRHSCASLLLAQGVPLRSIMELLGHSSIALTANTYTHLLPALQRETAQAWDRLAAGFGQPR